MQATQHVHSSDGATPEHYRRLGLDPYTIQAWEDGLRTDAGAGSFEWWYFDCHLEDGSKLTIEFHTKPPYVSPKQPLMPYVSLTLERPDGTQLQKAFTAPADSFSASRERCAVRIGSNTFSGDLRRYEIHVELDGVVADVTMTTDVPAWRPATGHVFFGDDEARYVAWLPAVPRGTVSARVALGGEVQALRGVGYHDHNWGNFPLRKLVDHWYFGHAVIEDYTVIALMFRSHAIYGGRTGAWLMLARGPEIISGTSDVRFSAAEPAFIAGSGVPVANRLLYELDLTDASDSGTAPALRGGASYGGTAPALRGGASYGGTAPALRGGASYAVSFVRQKDVFALDFGAAGAYQRFLGEVILERRASGQVVETARSDAFWELLYFGPRAHSV